MLKKSAHQAANRYLALRVYKVEQLFDAMDPSPFLNKDLNPEAERFIESWATGFSPSSTFHITVHIEQWPQEGDPGVVLSGAMRNHFAYKAERTRSDLGHFLWQGRISLVIGIVFVTLCLLAADAIGKLGTHGSIGIARESLTIVGWVAMWRPMQIFLYDWWPLQRQIRMYEKLGDAKVRVIQGT